MKPTIERTPRASASRLGWWSYETDWRRLVERDDVDLVDVCTPVDSRAEIAIAALQAGKHVLCESPLATTLAGAEAMCAAAEEASRCGVQAMVSLPYRRLAAIALARRLVAQGRLGAVRHVRAQYLQDWAVDPELPMVWRLQRDRAGSGALGDLGAHVIDLAQHVLGSAIRSVSGLTETFVRERPLAAEPGAPDGATGPVTVDDAALFLARFTSGTVGSFEATRCAAGRKDSVRLEINGSDGSLAFDFESMNELHFHDHTLDDGTAGFRRILVSQPRHPYVDPWRPSGHGLGYEHAVTCQVVDLVQDIVEGQTPSPSFLDGLQVQRVLAAVERSAESGSWQDVPSGR